MRIANSVSLLLLVAFAGCTDQPYGPDAGYEQGVESADCAALVGPIEAMVHQDIKPSAGTIAIATSWPDGLISPQLRSDLVGQGYQVAGPGAPAQHRLGYVIAQAEGQILVRVFLDRWNGAQLYQRDSDGHLQAMGPLVVGGAPG